MQRLIGVALVPLFLLACDSSTPADPSAVPQARYSIGEKLPEGSQVLISLPFYPEYAIGKTFVVKGDGNLHSAYCQSFDGIELYLNTVTLAGSGAELHGRGLLNVFADPMPQGTQLRITGLYQGVIRHCPPGNPIFTAEVINGA